jgi:hypothetical protein
VRWRFVLGVLAAFAGGCGKVGPPLPPFIRVPARPDNLVAERRGDMVVLRFAVPGENTDGSRPANLERVDVYGLTGPVTASDEEIRQFGIRIASLEVNPPPDPDASAEDAAPSSEPALQSGVDQGAIVSVTEQLTVGIMTPVTLPPPAKALPARVPALIAVSPAAPPPLVSVPTRVYVAVGVGARGRIGPGSSRARVPLLPAPSPPSRPAVMYDEESITVTWTAPEGAEPQAYHVYDVGTTAPEGPLVEHRLTTMPVSELEFVDRRIEWGAERCYLVRSVQSAAGLTMESDAPLPTCVTLRDTFAPAPPSGLTAVATAGAISLIWDAASASDLSGYLVLRGSARGSLTTVTPAPIQETSFRDIVPSGTRVLYAVQAVDKAGNVGPPSTVVEETSR